LKGYQNIMENNTHLVTIKNVLLFFMSIVLVMIIKELAALLIPLAFALFIALLLQPIIEYLRRKRWPYTVIITTITIITIGTLFLIGAIIKDTGIQIVSEKDVLLEQVSDKLDGIIDSVDHLPGLESLKADGLVSLLNSVLSPKFLLNTSGLVAGQLGTLTWNFLLTTIYLVAVLGSIVRYEKYIEYLEGDDDEGKQKMTKAFVEVKDGIVNYMKVKFFTSLCTGISFGVICWAFQINFYLFWGFLAFILNFIPTVGSITATIPPILLGLVQIESSGTLSFFILLLIGAQFLWGNIIEPMVMGSTVDLNIVFIIFGLVLWGYIWGVAGMLLSVPLVVLIRVILSQIPDAQMIVRIMGRSHLREQTN
jgi:AI-2 transport protein TqsA